MTRPPSRLRAGLAAAGSTFLLATLAVPLAAPAAAAEGFTVDPAGTPATVAVTDGPETPRALHLDIDVYVPDGAAAQPRPAIVMTHGFGLSKDAAEVRSMASYLARNGYVVLTYTAAGFGGSGGCISLQSVDFDAKSTSQLITKVLEQEPAVARFVQKDAKGAVVGTVGGSYGGGGQLVLAGIDRRVRAAAPGRTWNLLRYSLNPNNRVAPGDPTGFSHELNDQGVFKVQWSSLFFASGNAQPIGGAPPSGGPKGGCATDPYRSLTAVPVPLPSGPAGCVGFIGPVCETFARILATGTTEPADRRLLDRASGDTFIDPGRAAAAGGRPVDVPVLLVQGQRDTLFNVNDAVATYTDLRRRDVPVEMVWNWGGHGGHDSRPGECEVFGNGVGTGAPQYGGLEDCYLTGRTLDFFDRHLRAAPTRAAGFSWFRDEVAYLDGADGTKAADEQYGTAASFPAMPSTAFTLSGADALVPSGGPVTESSVTIVNPAGGQPSSYTETSNFTGPQSNPRDPRPPYDPPGQAASFTTPAFPADTDSVGVPTATLRLSHTAPGDLHLFAKVFDVAPDGSAELIHRLVSPVRVPSAALGQPVRLNLIGFAHRFPAGHRARLVLASTDQAYRNNPVADVVTVTTGTGSTFSLPMSPATAPPVAAPAAGPATAPAAAPSRTVVAAPSPRLPATGATAVLPALGGLLLLGALTLASGRRRGRVVSPDGRN